MMGALVAGGLAGNYDISRDREAETRLQTKQVNPDYDPNPKGFYEHGPLDMLSGAARGFVTKKVLSHWDYNAMQEGPQIPAPLRVICMMRPERERRASLKEWEWGPGGLEKRMRFQPLWGLWQQCHPYAETSEVWYSDLIDDPYWVFRRLQERGFPIGDIDAACNFIDPDLYRHR